MLPVGSLMPEKPNCTVITLRKSGRPRFITIIDLLLNSIALAFIMERDMVILRSRRPGSQKAVAVESVVVGGGAGKHGAWTPNIGQNSFTAFDTVKNTWLQLPNMHENRSLPCVGSLGSKLYVIGGASNETKNDDPIALQSAEVFDTSAGWSKLPSMHYGRFGSCAGILGGTLYAVGNTDLCPRLRLQHR